MPPSRRPSRDRARLPGSSTTNNDRTRDCASYGRERRLTFPAVSFLHTFSSCRPRTSRLAIALTAAMMELKTSHPSGRKPAVTKLRTAWAVLVLVVFASVSRGDTLDDIRQRGVLRW